MADPNGVARIMPEELEISGIKYRRADVPRETVAVGLDDLVDQLDASLIAPLKLSLKGITAAVDETRGMTQLHGRVMHELQGLLHRDAATVNLEPLVRAITRLEESQGKIVNAVTHVAGLHTQLNARLSKFEEMVATLERGVHVVFSEQDGRRLAAMDANIQLLVDLLDQRTAPPPAETAAPSVTVPSPVPADLAASVRDLPPEAMPMIAKHLDAEMAKQGASVEERAEAQEMMQDLGIRQAVEQTLGGITPPQVARPAKTRRRPFTAAERREVFNAYVENLDLTLEQLAEGYDTDRITVGRIVNEVAQADGRIKALKRKREHIAAARVSRMNAARSGRNP